MQLTSLAPAGAAALFLLVTARILYGDGTPLKNGWLLPAALSLAFLLFSVQTVMAEGALGFWTEHTSDLWGNQIWFDLLLAVGIAWFLVVPLAKAQGMRLMPWWLLIVCTGCIGFLALVARLLYLQEHADQPGPVASPSKLTGEGGS
jgi:hypothetical protein